MTLLGTAYLNSAGDDVYTISPQDTFDFSFGNTDNSGSGPAGPSGRGGASNSFTIDYPATVDITHSGIVTDGDAGLGISTTVLSDDANPIATASTFSTTSDRISAGSSTKSYRTTLPA